MKNYILIDPTKINEEDQSLNEALPSPPPPPPRKPRRKPSAPAASAPQAGTQGAGGGTQGAGGGTQGTGNGRPSVPTPGVPGQTKEDEDPWYIWLLESMGITAEDHTMLFNIVGEMAQRLLDGIFGFSQDELERLYIAIIEGDLEEAYKQLRPNIIDVAHWAKEKMKVTLGGGEGEYTQEELDEWEFWIDGLALLICTGFAMNLARA